LPLLDSALATSPGFSLAGLSEFFGESWSADDDEAEDELAAAADAAACSCCSRMIAACLCCWRRDACNCWPTCRKYRSDSSSDGDSCFGDWTAKISCSARRSCRRHKQSAFH